MYAVTGITGRVGGVVARTLLDAGLSVRAVVRDDAKSAAWKKRGSEVALAEMNDAEALTAAFTAVDGVFVLRTSVAMTAKDAMKAFKSAGALSKSFKPPGR
jgi:NAD(P)H dehydrogenase (quinone)